MTPTPLTADEAFAAAVERHQAGRLAEAETLYRQVLARRPDDPKALHLLGLLAVQAGRLEVAIPLLQRVVTLEPQLAEAHSNLGAALATSGHLDEAIAVHRRAVVLEPDSADAHTRLAQALKTAGQMDQAISAFREAFRCEPESFAACCLLGNALFDAGHTKEAIAVYRDAVRLEPENPAAHSNLGNALPLEGQLDEAVAACREAVRLRPDFAEAHNNLGNCLKQVGQLEAALEAFRTAVALQPNSPEIHSNLVYAAHFHPASTAAGLLAESREWSRRHEQPLQGSHRAHANDPSPDRRLRIGYVSPDFRNHVVGNNLLPLLRAHDHERFEIFCYADLLRPDSWTEQFRALADHWRDIRQMPDEMAAALIREDGIDILVDLTLHMAYNRLPIFARKPAPVQVTYLGYCGTTGLDAMDYRLSDPFLDPPGADLSCYREQTVRLPRSYWCYEPLGATPAVPALPALHTGFVTFGSLNNFSKVSPAALDLWLDLLETAPPSRLLLHAPEGSCREQILARGRNRGLAAERFEFVAFDSWEQYLRNLQRIDVALDPFPYGGGITTCDALWMGVPVVTLSGQTAVGRGGRSILSNIGLPELIAETPEQYIEIAATLAHNLPRLGELRSNLRQRIERSPLRDAAGHVRDFEAALRGMWQGWRAP